MCRICIFFIYRENAVSVVVRIEIVIYLGGSLCREVRVVTHGSTRDAVAIYI
jgi:hypothetical protein